MKNDEYKLVVKNTYKTWVKSYSPSKEKLEEEAVHLSKKHPHWTMYIVKENYNIS